MNTNTSLEINLLDELILDEKTVAALFLEARTANSWADDEVSTATLEAIFRLTRMGPTAMNIQPLRITWVKSAPARQRLVTHMFAGNKEKTLGAPMVAILSYDPAWHETLVTTTPHIADRAATFGADAALREEMAIINSHIQSGYFIIAARAAGLAAGPMTGFNADGVNSEFFAGSSRRSFMVVNLGHPDTIQGRARLPRLGSDVATQTI